MIITKEGVEFVLKRYSGSVALDHEEIKLYGFLLRLLSFGGKLPLTLIRKMGYDKILRKALTNHYIGVTTLEQKLPMKQVQGAIEEIWGEIPKGIYV